MYALYESWEDVEVAIVDECRINRAISLRAVEQLNTGYFPRCNVDVDSGWASLAMGG